MIGLHVIKFHKRAYEQKECIKKHRIIPEDYTKPEAPQLDFNLLLCGKPDLRLVAKDRDRWYGKHTIGIEPSTTWYNNTYQSGLSWTYRDMDANDIGEYSYGGSLCNYYLDSHSELLNLNNACKTERASAYSCSFYLGAYPRDDSMGKYLTENLTPTFINYLLIDKLQVQLLLNSYLHAVQNGNTVVYNYPSFVSAFISGLHIPSDLWVAVRALQEVFSGTATEILEQATAIKPYTDLKNILNKYFNNDRFSVTRTIWNDSQFSNSKDNKKKGKLNRYALGAIESIYDFKTNKSNRGLNVNVIDNYNEYLTYLCGGLKDSHPFKQYMKRKFNDYYDKYIKSIPFRENLI